MTDDIDTTTKAIAARFFSNEYPRDSLASLIAAALRAERERCAKIVCRYCYMDWPIDEGYHVSPSGRAVPCLAAALRAAPSTATLGGDTNGAEPSTNVE